MKTYFYSILKKAALTSYFLGVIFLIAGVLLTTIHSPARAANPMQAACSVPPDWNQTVRLYFERETTRKWTFEVEEAEMDVELEFFYYQDRDPEGCPFDCGAGDCQLDEIGVGTSPFGEFAVEDGIEGVNSGAVRQSGRLSQGSYEASFSVTGKGSINIGLRIHKKAVPPPPADTATPTPTQEIATPTPTQVVLPPVPTATNTLPPVDATPTDQVEPPAPTATETSTPETPTGVTPTATSTDSVLPPVDSEPTPTATPTDEVRPPRPRRTPTPPATLPPPSAPTQSGQPPILVPVTGGDLSALDQQDELVESVFLKLGAALLGLALVLHGIGIPRSKIDRNSITETGDRRDRSR